MAKPDSGRITMTILLLTVIFFLLKYIVNGVARTVQLNEYLLLTLVTGNILQMYYFNAKSYDSLRKEKRNEVCYKLFTPPLYPLMIISAGLGIFCVGYIFYLNASSFSTEAGFGLFFISLFFFGPCLATMYQMVNHRNYYFKVNAEAFIYDRGGVDIKILFQDVEWVDYITKRMDMRRGYQKIGIVFKLLNGTEIELNTWRYGFTEKDVTNLMGDIRTRSSGTTLTEKQG
jgi:hypothetical protein